MLIDSVPVFARATRTEANLWPLWVQGSEGRVVTWGRWVPGDLLLLLHVAGVAATAVLTVNTDSELVVSSRSDPQPWDGLSAGQEVPPTLCNRSSPHLWLQGRELSCSPSPLSSARGRSARMGEQS